VHDPVQWTVLVSENNMSCKPTKDHVEQQVLSQKQLQDPCITHMEELPNEVLEEPLPFVEQVATNNDALQLLDKSLQTPKLEPLASMTDWQESSKEVEVQFLSMISAQETECNASDGRNISDCQRKKGQPDVNHKQHMNHMPDSDGQVK